MNMMKSYTAVQSHKAVSAYFTSKQILPFGFAQQYSDYINSPISINIRQPANFIKGKSLN